MIEDGRVQVNNHVLYYQIISQNFMNAALKLDCQRVTNVDAMKTYAPYLAPYLWLVAEKGDGLV